MKILVLQDDFPPNERGGAGVISGLIARGLVSSGHDVSIITSVQNKNLAGKFVENKMNVYRIYSKYHERWRPYLSLNNILIIPQIKKIIAEIKPDVVHAHNIHYHISYRLLKIARRHTDKVFLTAHDIMSFYQGTFTEFIDKKNISCPEIFNYKVTPLLLLKAFRKRYNPFHNMIVRHYLSYVTKIIVVSDALKEALSQNNIYNTTVINNGIDVGNWEITKGESDQHKKSLGLEGCDVVIFGGRLSGAKGGDLILQAMTQVFAQRSSARLIIFGRKDSYTDRILNRARELGIEQCLVIVGWQGEDVLKRHYSIANLAVVPSVCFDSFPTVNLQAFASGKPVIATCFGGSREIVHNEENGFIINPYDIYRLADKILYLLKNPDISKRFGQKGRELVIEKYTLTKMVNNYLSIFS